MIQRDDTVVFKIGLGLRVFLPAFPGINGLLRRLMNAEMGGITGNRQFGREIPLRRGAKLDRTGTGEFQNFLRPAHAAGPENLYLDLAVRAFFNLIRPPLFPLRARCVRRHKMRQPQIKRRIFLRRDIRNNCRGAERQRR